MMDCELPKPNIGVKFLCEEARRFGLPKYCYSGDAGVDLHVILPNVNEDKVIYPGERITFDSGISLSLDHKYWAFITHRSSTEKRKRLRVITGVIDSEYTGPLLCQVANDNSFPITVKHGDRLAQLIILPRIFANFTEIEDLPETDRGGNGFGSTG